MRSRDVVMYLSDDHGWCDDLMLTCDAHLTLTSTWEILGVRVVFYLSSIFNTRNIHLNVNPWLRLHWVRYDGIDGVYKQMSFMRILDQT